MDEEINALANRVHDLIALVRALREENQRLRTQLADADSDLASMRQRVENASHQIDQLIETLPDTPSPPAAV